MTSDLIARLEALTGPCREVDYLIGEHTGAEMGLSGDAVGLGYAKFTASLDTAVALVERCLPGWTYLLNNDGGNMADLFSPTWPHGKNFDATGATMPIAICAATLRALEAEGARDGN